MVLRAEGTAEVHTGELELTILTCLPSVPRMSNMEILQHMYKHIKYDNENPHTKLFAKFVSVVRKSNWFILSALHSNQLS